MNRTQPTIFAVAAAALVAAAGSLSSAQALPLLVDYELSGSSYFTSWETLFNNGSPIAPTAGTGTLAVAAPGFRASAGLYSFSDHYAFTTSKADFALGIDLKNVIFQVDWSPNAGENGEFAVPFGGGPMLSFNGGSQNLLANFSGITGSEVRSTFSEPQTYDGWAFQWDLSSIEDEITSISIVTPVGVHTSVMAAQLQASDSYAPVVVPEPTTVSLMLLAGGVAFARRRRSSLRA